MPPAKASTRCASSSWAAPSETHQGHGILAVPIPSQALQLLLGQRQPRAAAVERVVVNHVRARNHPVFAHDSDGERLVAFVGPGVIVNRRAAP